MKGITINLDENNDIQKEMFLLKERKFLKGKFDECIINQLRIFTTYKIETETITTGEEVQKYYVPKDEFEFYNQWLEKASEELKTSNTNIALAKNIARQHSLYYRD